MRLYCNGTIKCIYANFKIRTYIMITVYLKAFLFSLFFLGIACNAASEDKTTQKTEQTTKNDETLNIDESSAIDEETTIENEKLEKDSSELEKCEALKTKLLGANFNLKRMAATTIITAPLSLILIKLLMKAVPLNLRYLIYYSLYLGASRILFDKFLKKYECNRFPITFSGPIGISLYALFNRFTFCANLDKILANYDADEIPTCIKNEFDALAEVYKANDGTIEMNMSDKIEFIEMTLDQLNQIIAPKTEENKA